MRNYKQLIAGAMAAIMVLGSSVVALAADQEGKGTGTGSLDIVKNADVFDVVLPTDAGTSFNYILDPTGVIGKTNHEKYGDATFETGKTIYFKNADGNYTDTSDVITVTNKSSVDVDVTVTASVAKVSGITMVSDGDFSSDNDTNAKLYLALIDSKDYSTNPAAIDDDGVEAGDTLAGDDDWYKVVYVSSGDYYEKVIDESKNNSYNDYTFKLTGACNPKGDWGTLTDTPPTVEVVWTVKDPTVTGPTVSMTAAGAVTLTGLTGDKNIANNQDIAIIDGDGKKYVFSNPTVTIVDATGWTSTTGGTLKYQLKSDWNVLNGKTVKIEVSLGDGSKITSNSVVLNVQ